MKISIITATWNSGATLRDTLESVLSQTHQDWEHIIVDGASTDNTLQIIDEYKLRYAGKLKLISEPDKGIYDAMNKGIAKATGDLIGFLNSDDFYSSPNSLKYINRTAIDTNADAVYGGVINVNFDDIDKILWYSKAKEKPKKGFRSGWHPPHPAFYAKKSCFDKYGGFDLKYRIAADLDLMMRFIDKYGISIYVIPEFITTQRLGGASNQSLKALLKSNKEVLNAFEKNGMEKPSFYMIKKLSPKVFRYLKHICHLD